MCVEWYWIDTGDGGDVVRGACDGVVLVGGDAIIFCYYLYVYLLIIKIYI